MDRKKPDWFRLISLSLCALFASTTALFVVLYFFFPRNPSAATEDTYEGAAAPESEDNPVDEEPPASVNAPEIPLSLPEPENNPPDLPYASLYPEMTAPPRDTVSRKEKTVYLTFDDGPSAVTAEVLDILKEKNVRATFFVVGSEIEAHPGLVRRAAEEGHTVGVHTYSHLYKKIYASVEDYLNDFYLAYMAIYRETGEYPTVFRFPGGSINSYNKRLYKPIIAEMLRRGFEYYDWNVSAEDSSGSYEHEDIVRNVVNGLSGMQRAFVLMHDFGRNKNLCLALPDIIDRIRELGYSIEPITDEVATVSFSYPDT